MSINSIIRTRRFAIICTIAILLVMTIVFISYAVKHIVKKNNYLGSYDSESHFGMYKKYAVSTDSAQCANIGKQILDVNGTAADAIIAVLLCMGVTIPHSMGLGGGSLMVFYNSTTREANVIDAREEAPSLAHRDLIKNYEEDKYLPLSIGIPGELAGYWELHQRFGRLKWNHLFNGAISLSKNGFYVSKHLSDSMKYKEKYIKNYSSLRDIFVDQKTGECYKQGDRVMNLRLAQTLENIAQSGNPLKLFYNGIIAESIIEDIKDFSKEMNSSSIITLKDFQRYEVRTDINPVKTYFSRGSFTLYSAPLPGSGNILSFIMKVMENYDDLYPNAKKSLDKSVLFYHRLIETFKYAYSQRTLLGDDKYDDVSGVLENITSNHFINNIRNKIDDTKTYPIKSLNYGDHIHITEDHGTAHVSVIDKDGNAAAVSTTINSFFGSKIFSKRTGILLNDELFDFKFNDKQYKYPASERNLLSAGKRPLSSMCPSIITDKSGNVKLVIGGSGGMKITTAIATVAIRHLWLNEDIKQAIDAPRIHHQLSPDEVVYENNFPEDILIRLEKMGHKLKLLNGRGAIIMAISRDNNNKLFANSDYRKGGDVDGA